MYLTFTSRARYYKYMPRLLLILSVLLCAACATRAPEMTDMEYGVVSSSGYDIATWSRIISDTAPIHIYVEGDGHAFNSRGVPTSDPTPRGRVVRELAASDMAPNVAYIARPCQYIMSPTCNVTDWTTGRFSPCIITAMADTVRHVAGTRPIILIGYSGGAMITGLIIQNNPDLDIQKWITIAGVLNHADWTTYFGDAPLAESMDMTNLPRVPQVHYVASHDRVVPIELTRRMASPDDIIIVPDTAHSRMGNLNLDFSVSPLTK